MQLIKRKKKYQKSIEISIFYQLSYRYRTETKILISHITVCVCVCVRVCVWACAANLLVVGLVMHHRGSVFCDIANGSSPVPDRVVETRQGQGALELALQFDNGASHAYMHFMHAHTTCINVEQAEEVQVPATVRGPSSCHVVHLA